LGAKETSDENYYKGPEGWNFRVDSSSSNVPDNDGEDVDDADGLPWPGYGKRQFDDDSKLRFEPREEFGGRRSGFVFRLGSQGLGYYEDVKLL
jgi:hypothetical protein